MFGTWPTSWLAHSSPGFIILYSRGQTAYGLRLEQISACTCCPPSSEQINVVHVIILSNQNIIKVNTRTNNIRCATTACNTLSLNCAPIAVAIPALGAPAGRPPAGPSPGRAPAPPLNTAPIAVAIPAPGAPSGSSLVC